MIVEKVALQTHITAIIALGETGYLLEGCGGFINLFDVNSNKLLENVDVFEGSRISGIRVSLDLKTIIIFGGKKVMVAKVALNSNPSIHILSTWMEKDWIQDIKIIEEESCTCIAMLTSHNKIIIEETPSRKGRIEIQSIEHCILYSGKIIGDCLSQLVVLAGTVFGDIIVWSAAINNRVEPQDKRKTLHRLSGHNGAIFSVNYDENTRTIITTSDDRSVRTWAVDSSAACSSADVLNIFQQSHVIPHQKFYGHEARIWSSVIIRRHLKDDDLNFVIASLGEDSRVCLWDFKTGELISKIDAHPGASIWTGDWNAKCLMTGGGDGSIGMNHVEGPTNYHLPLPNDKDIPRVVVAISKGFITLSQLGCIYGCSDELNSPSWTVMFQDVRLRSGTVVHKNGNTIIFGSPSGAVLVFFLLPGPALKLISQLQLAESKIYSIHLIGTEEFIACFDEGKMVVGNYCQYEKEASATYNLILPDGKQRWPACAIKTREALIVGDRDGSLHFFKAGNEMPLQSFQFIHGKNGITDVQVDPLDSRFVFSTGKDGRVGLWKLLDDLSGLELVSVTNTSLGWIARLCWVEHELFYLAFHSDRFVVWSHDQQRSVMPSVKCGGGHRSFDFDVSPTRVTFLFVKDKVVNGTRYPFDSIFNLSLPGRCGGHSKSVCRARFIGWKKGEPLILSGSEDTNLRLAKIVDRSLHSLMVIPKHVSSIRCLAVKEVPDRPPGTCLCVSAGGRAQLTVGLLTVSGDDSNPLRVIYHDVKTHFLCGFFHRASNKPWMSSERKVVPDPETRYMDVDVIYKSDNHFHIFAACSDGFIRCFDLSLNTRRLEILQEWSFHNCCVLQVKIVASDAGEALLLSAGTNGRLAVWNVSEMEEDSQIEPLGSLIIHQSGINSLDCRWTGSNNLFILSGGDDNALNCTVLDVGCEKKMVRVIDQQKNCSAHAAQISGVAILLDGCLALSVSLDQRLILWRLINNRLTWLQTVCCDVADIQGLDILKTDDSDILALVHGQGIQILMVHAETVSSVSMSPSS